MNRSISDLFFSFIERSLPVKQVADYVAYSQNEFYFHLAALKNSRIKQLKTHFEHTIPRKIILGANLSGIGFELEGIHVEYLGKGFFQEDDPLKLNQKLAYLENSIVILNNNDVGHQGGMPYYAKFYSRCDKTIFVTWDWDNHHWLELSTFLAAHSDIYAPAHHENLYLLSRFNWLIAGPVYCGTVQWSKSFLAEHLSELLCSERANEPLGMHIPYSHFRFRMQVITTLNQRYRSIGFTDRSFHARTSNDRLQEWGSYKSHWIVPVLNDVPIRIFDALVTGGIPIVPKSLQFMQPVQSINRDSILFYSPQDIIDPLEIVAKANQLFEHGGKEKIIERHNYAIEKHHGFNRICQILDYLKETFELNFQSV